MKKEIGGKAKQEHKGNNVAKSNRPAGAGRPDQQRRDSKPQHNHKVAQKEKALPEGDLQLKLEALKNMFKK